MYRHVLLDGAIPPPYQDLDFESVHLGLPLTLLLYVLWDDYGGVDIDTLEIPHFHPGGFSRNGCMIYFCYTSGLLGLHHIFARITQNMNFV